MKITDIHIDGFGVWNDLKISGLSPRLTAFYGANEAGKTTLMQFTRSVLYGVSAERRQRYLPPVNGGRPGGALGILEEGQALTINRIADRGPNDHGWVQICSGTGEAAGDRQLREALADIDEVTYNHIFALGLSEIQTLGTLSGSQAAEWIYRLTSGLDRVSLYDVIQNLRQTREGLLAGSDRPSKIDQLISRRDALRGEIEQLAQRSRHWAQLSVRIEELDAEITNQEARVRDSQHEARTIEIAVAIKPNWRKRAKLSAQIRQLDSNLEIPSDGIQRLDALNEKQATQQRQLDVLRGQRQQLIEESKRLDINLLLVKNAHRIDALGEQRDWLQSLERQIDDLGAEAETFEQRLANEQQRIALALGAADGEHLRGISNADIESLQPQIEALRAARQQTDRAQHEVDTLAESERSLQAKIETATLGGESHGLPMDVSEASDLVAQLRSRLKIEQRIEQARNHEMDLEHQSHELLDDQVIPLTTFNWMLAGVVLSGLLLGTWLWLPNSPFGDIGGLMALVSFGMIVFSFVFKFFAEDSAADKLDACQRQMDVVARQLKEAQQEKKKLDAQLPLTDGSVLIRLQAAERHLAELENVLPVQAQRMQAGHQVTSAEAKLAQAQDELSQVLKTWKSKLVGLGFSEQLDPQVFLTVTERYEALSDLEARAKLRREEADVRQREYQMVARRIHDLAECVGCVLGAEQEASRAFDRKFNHVSNAVDALDLNSDLDSEDANDDDSIDGSLRGHQAPKVHRIVANPLDQLEHLVSQRSKQLSEVERRRELRQRSQELKAEASAHRETIAGIQRRREALLQAVDCEDETAYRSLAEQQQQVLKLKKQRKGVTREILAAIGQHTTEEALSETLHPKQVDQLETLWETATSVLAEQQQTLTELAGERGALQQQQQAEVEDRSLAERQLELSEVVQQLAEARHSWREHATVNRVLERIRSEYEQNRQPETLAVASRYLAQLTGGEYRRIWTPLADDILLVENAEGESLTVDVLSRGTREQLFLSVRLALVANFASRGIQLPMVLDDVLVNFDAVRTERAAKVLCDFAADGHQLLVFTCHEHMWQMFKKLDADCRRLPTRGEQEVVEPIADPIVKAIPAPVVQPEPVAAPPELYDYPFVEKIEAVTEDIEAREAAPEPAPPINETPYTWTTPEADALAYILDSESAPEGESHQRLYRDHLEPRRA